MLTTQPDNMCPISKIPLFRASAKFMSYTGRFGDFYLKKYTHKGVILGARENWPIPPAVVVLFFCGFRETR